MGNVKEIFKKLIKRKIFMAVLLLFLIVVFVAVKKMPKGSEPAAVKEFSMKNDMLAGNQDGVVSIVNIASRKQLFSLNLNKIYEKDYEPAELNIIKSSPEAEEEPGKVEDTKPDQANDVVKDTGGKFFSDRSVEVVGEKEGYDIVAINIIKGDCWIKVQRKLISDVPEFKLLKWGREINDPQELHPIYVGDVRLFLAKKGTFSKNTSKTEVGNIFGGRTSESGLPEAEEISDQALIENITWDIETAKDSLIPDYNYSFTDKGFFVYDNVRSKLYQIFVKDNQLELSFIADNKDIVVKDYQFENGIFYFTVKDDSNIYILDGEGYKRVAVDYDLEDWTVDGNFLYYAANKSIFKIDLKTKEQMYVYLGDKTTDIEIIGDYLYIANKFGLTVNKSILHKFDKNLVSYGWAELNYAKDTKIVYEKDGEFLLKQSFRDNKDKLVYVNKDFRLSYEVSLDVSIPKLAVYNAKCVYGAYDEILYIYDIQGVLTDRVKLNISDIHIL